MKKRDLKTGMIVEQRDGDLALVVINNCYGTDGIIHDKGSWSGFDSFGDDLKWTFLNNCEPDECDIMKVYEPTLPTGMLSRVDLNLIWEREEYKEEKIYEIDGVEYSETTLKSLIKKATS